MQAVGMAISSMLVVVRLGREFSRGVLPGVGPALGEEVAGIETRPISKKGGISCRHSALMGRGRQEEGRRLDGASSEPRWGESRQRKKGFSRVNAKGGLL